MLRSILIENFRLFRHLQIGPLGEVNLFVGKNNSGKSALLEALQVFASNAKPEVLLDLVEARHELWNPKSGSRPADRPANPLRHLFFGHQLPQIDDPGITVGESDEDAPRLRISLGAFRREVQKDGTVSSIRVPVQVPGEEWSDVEIYFVIEEDRQRTLRAVPLDAVFDRRYALDRQRFAADRRMPNQLVPTGKMSNSRTARLWDLTGLTDLEPEVIAGLQLIEPRATAIAFVGETARTGGTRIPLVKIRGVKDPLPLRSMGDGVTRLFHIILALVNARDGILLIDEFENGLHWSVQPMIWQTVFRLSARLNVQVFATTHSRDCIRGFETAWNDFASAGAFFRLDVKGEGEVKAVPYSLETLSDSLEMNVEVR